MRYLLDTHLLIWIADDAPRLPRNVRQLVLDRGNELWFSAASIWEIVIKTSLGKLSVDARVFQGELLGRGYQSMDVSPHDVLEILNLPLDRHRDPFDRLLVAQSRARGIILVTSDEQLAHAYPDSPVELHPA